MSTLSHTIISRKHSDRACLSDIAVLQEPCAWVVSLQCSIAAETRRIFHALTLPEHMESWLTFPCCNSSHGNQASWLSNDFSLTHACDANGSLLTINGSYSTCRTRKLAFTWTLENDCARNRTYVDIRLCGDFDRSSLRLEHVGFDSESQFAWHQALWSASMRRLRELFEPPVGSRDRFYN